MTTRQAAQVAGVSDDYVRRLCRVGVFGARHSITGSWLIDSRDLAAWMAARSRRERDTEAA